METAIALDPLRLNKQLLETQQILDALNGKKAWSRHPAVLQYRGYEEYLRCYLQCFKWHLRGNLYWTELFSCQAQQLRPEWHCAEYYTNMKKRLYTKNPEHYKQWAHLGTSDCNWYWSQEENRFIKYVNGKRI